MAQTHPQRFARALLKIAEDPASSTQEKLDATQKYIDLIRDKTSGHRVRKPKTKSNLLG